MYHSMGRGHPWGNGAAPCLRPIVLFMLFPDKAIMDYLEDELTYVKAQIRLFSAIFTLQACKIALSGGRAICCLFTLGSHYRFILFGNFDVDFLCQSIDFFVFRGIFCRAAGMQFFCLGFPQTSKIPGPIHS